MSGPELLHGQWSGAVLGTWALAAAAVAAAAWSAARRRERLLGAAGAPAGRAGAADALLVAALLAAAVGVLGPTWGTRRVQVPASGVDVVILIDVSLSMEARDVPPTRLARARALTDALLSRLSEGDRAALAAFAGRGVLLTPLTPDKEALRALIPALDSELMDTGGSQLASGVEAALEAFGNRSPRPRVLLVLSDGEDPEQAANLGGALAARADARVVAVLYGDESGAVVPDQGGTLRDAWGRDVVTRADPARLALLADATAGVLFRGDRFGRVDLERVLVELRRDAAQSPSGFVERRLPVDRSGVLAAAALALLLLEVRLRGDRVPRGASLSGRPAAVATLAAALLLLGAGAPSQPDTDGAELLRTGVRRAEDGDLAGAERAFFAAAVGARDARIAADAYFDLGVAALRQKDFESASAAFFDALALAPGDRRIQFNLEWTLRARTAAATRGGDPKAERRDDGHEEEAPRPERAERENERQPSPRPDPRPDDAKREPRQARGADSRREPLELDPEAARHWLGKLRDDPGRAMRNAARAQGGSDVRRGRPGW